MDDDAGPSLTGKLLKVLHVDHDSLDVHCRQQDGQIVHFSVIQGEPPEPGSVILLSATRWQYAPEELWQATNITAIVRSLQENGDILVDNGITIIRVRNLLGLTVAVHNTVEYNDTEGLVRVVAQTPIRSREYGTDQNDILNEYAVDTSGDGPGFADFGGYPEVIARARELIATQLDRRALLEEIGARPVKGVLFTGPPGTGKTHLARIIAHESKADFFLVSGPSIVSKWVGDTEDTLRKIFEAAAACASKRAIIFFDEIDSIAERRGGDSHEASRRLVAQMLTLMDGFSQKDSSVVVIAATNRANALDPALTRPGRFDWEIEFGMPNVYDRLEILRVHARRLKTADWLPITDLASLTDGWSAAELSALWVEAALLAAGEGRGAIVAEDMALAFERVARRPRRALQTDQLA